METQLIDRLSFLTNILVYVNGTLHNMQERAPQISQKDFVEQRQQNRLLFHDIWREDEDMHSIVIKYVYIHACSNFSSYFENLRLPNLNEYICL